jgi:hypothetical protein
VIGDLNKYMQYQSAEAIRDAAKNPGGVAGIGAGMGAGMAMAGQMGSAFQQQQQPPPLPATGASFFVAINNQQSGPFDIAALRQQIQSGRLTKQTLVWKSGMAQWTAAEQVSEIAPMFAEVPPPLPS